MDNDKQNKCRKGKDLHHKHHIEGERGDNCAHSDMHSSCCNAPHDAERHEQEVCACTHEAHPHDGCADFHGRHNHGGCSHSNKCHSYGGCESSHGGHTHDGCACCAPEKISIEEHSHAHGGADIKEIITLLVKIVCTVLSLTAGSLLLHFLEGIAWGEGLGISLCVLAYLIIGGGLLVQSVKNLFKGKLFDEIFLMTVASLGALILQEYIEACAVVLLYTIGEALQDAAVGRSRNSVSALLNLKSATANIVADDGSISVIDTDELRIGDIILIKAGERVPSDATVTEGESYLDCSALTGEGVPVTVKVGDSCLSGAINAGGAIKARVDKEYADSTVARIMQLVEDAQDSKPKAQKFITKFAKWYTPCVVLLALIVAFVSPAFSGYTLEALKLWVNRALVFLVISCPCALVISIPLSYFAGIGACSINGVLVKGGNYLEALSKVDVICTDKTGTLTKGVFEVKDIVPADGSSSDELIKIAAHCEVYSNHPIALSVLRAYSDVDASAVSDYSEGEGGVSCTYKGSLAICGNLNYLASLGVQASAAVTPYTVIYCAWGGEYKGYITISDTLKPDSAQAVAALRGAGMDVAMLTGDNAAVAEAVGKELGIDEVHAACLPQDKCAIVADKIAKGHTVAFIGDGLNDAPVLKSASVGVCMGGIGNDASVEAGDIVLVNPSPAALVKAKKIADKTKRIVIQNIVLSLAVKLLIMLLSVTGVYSAMWLAVVADVGVCLLAILNAMRISVRKGGKLKEKDSSKSLGE